MLVVLIHQVSGAPKSTQPTWEIANAITYFCGKAEALKTIFTTLGLTSFICILYGICQAWKSHFQSGNQDLNIGRGRRKQAYIAI